MNNEKRIKSKKVEIVILKKIDGLKERNKIK